jgi:histidyl-tRNA synthetase
MSRPQAPRGTRDLLPAERAAFLRLESVARDLATRYGYQPIETPLFEQAEVFERGVGAVTDVVEKELFRVQAGRGDAERERWALRPEPTAGIVRAYVQHGMQTLPQPVKLTLVGPMFRYDRPQAGRYRQFWQFDVEALGDPGPAIDAEIIELATRFYAEAGLPEVELRLNSIGDQACRPAYIAALRAYLEPMADQLPELERQRLATAPLRLLDSKDPVMQPIIAGAPVITDLLCDACQAHFDGLRRHLDAVGVAFHPEPRLVRGLDYYTRTTFEFYPSDRDGQQDALGGGGRYDGLVEILGGKPTPGIGFGLGLDRVVLAMGRSGMPGDPAPALVAVVGTRPDDQAERLIVAGRLRELGLRVRPDGSERKLGRQLESAAKLGARWAVIVGEELTRGAVMLKDLADGTQREVPLDTVAGAIRDDG